ncbi:MAG TPA: hypothetical protein VMH88_09345 [Gemmatimonadales bacterium]|nr:hypothetical protein [Gemmatimonadales bacterium]
MHTELIALRLVHILLGVFWAGSLVFMAVFLEPSLRAAGPAGAPVMQQLAARRLLQIMPVVALVTILSGLRLMAIMSNGFTGEWMRSRSGTAYSVGAAAALLAFGMGILVMRPTMKRLMLIGADPARASEAQVLRLRSTRTGQIVAVLLTITAAAMAIGRYL